jgi:cytoskeletal protein CcmA (bactofilin family)
MPRDANGTYTLPIAPFQPLTLAKSADMNTALTDIADALTDSQSRASPTPAQGDLNLNGHNILNLGEVVGALTATGGVYANGEGSAFGFALEGPNYIWHWGVANYFDWFNGATGMRSWRAGGSDVMTLDPSGNLHANGTISAGGAISTPSNISASGNASIGGTVTANIVNANGITSYGNLTVSGNVSTGNVTASGTVSGGYVTSTGNVNAAGTLTGGALNIGGGTITAGQINASGT